MPAFLEVTIGGKTSRVTCGGIVTMGRDASNTIQVKDPLISRNHALIRAVGVDQYYMLDTGSRNGCFVNDMRITTPTLLKSGDQISIGNTKMVFKQITIPEAAPGGEQESLGETISFVRNDIKSVTILVADIRGYTTLSEQVPITTLSGLMSKWFTNVQSVIERNNGRVDKFIGDCVMALWDTERDPEKVVKYVLKASFEIHVLTRDLSLEYPDITQPLRIGVGLNTGMAALGIGADNTAMGDTVNLAFRLETATKQLNADLVMAESTYSNCPESLWGSKVQSITVKGKSAPLNVCGLNWTEVRAYVADISPDAAEA